MAGLPSWTLDLIACPVDDCGERVAIKPGGATEDGALLHGQLACTGCGNAYPVVGGAAIMVPYPHRWLGSYREPVLATLAEFGLASTEAVELVTAYADLAPDAEPHRFGDDWVQSEARAAFAEPWPEPPGPGPASAPFAEFLRAARTREPEPELLGMLGEGDLGTVVEVGTGAGRFARLVRPRSSHLLLVDSSLRAVLRSRRAAEHSGGADLAAVVADAQELALQAESVDHVVAAEVIDLLDQPGAFLEHARLALKSGGRLAVATPAPELGDIEQDDTLLDQLIDATGLDVTAEHDAIPWVRPHGSRYYQVYFVRIVVASRP